MQKTRQHRSQVALHLSSNLFTVDIVRKKYFASNKQINNQNNNCNKPKQQHQQKIDCIL